MEVARRPPKPPKPFLFFLFSFFFFLKKKFFFKLRGNVGLITISHFSPPVGIQFVALTAGANHFCGIRGDNQRVECWGIKEIHSCPIPSGQLILGGFELDHGLKSVLFNLCRVKTKRRENSRVVYRLNVGSICLVAFSCYIFSTFKGSRF
jgi:hypothetical protein